MEVAGFAAISRGVLRHEKRLPTRASGSMTTFARLRLRRDGPFDDVREAASVRVMIR